MHALEQLTVKCEVAGIRVSHSKLKAMILNQKKGGHSLWVGELVSVPRAEELKFLGVMHEWW